MKYGHGWIPAGVEAEALKPDIEKLQQMAQEAGRSALEVVAMKTLPIDDPPKALDYAKGFAEVGVTHLVHTQGYESATEYRQNIDYSRRKNSASVSRLRDDWGFADPDHSHETPTSEWILIIGGPPGMPKLKEIGIGVENVNARDYVGQAQAAERLGFHSFWVPEDYVFPGAFSSGAAIATATSRIKIGTGVINPLHPSPCPHRHGIGRAGPALRGAGHSRPGCESAAVD